MAPTQLGPYAIERVLGKGGMGTVYAAVDTTTGQPAAVKVLAAPLGLQEGFRERFTSEIESLRLLRHPNIVRLLGFGEEGDCYYYAMELVEGQSLEDQMRSGRVFTPAEVVEIGLQVCHALKHAHAAGVVHRDLKPANLLVSADGEIKLSDFGIARLFGSAGITRDGGIIGTAQYMAPEQADGRPATARCDLYSLGAVLYALLARRPPFVAETVPEMLQLQRFAPPEPVRHFAPDTPEELDALVLQLLAKSPDERIPTALVLSRRLEAVAQALATSPQRAADEPRPEARRPATTSAPCPGKPSEAPAGATSEGKFIPVVDQADAGSRWEMAVNTARAWVSPQMLAPIVALALVAVAAWYTIQPPSADTLYQQVRELADNGRLETSTRAESDIERFLARYGDDPRAEEMRGYLDRIELAKDERRYENRARGLSFGSTPLGPAETAYVEAISLLERDAESGRRKLQAIIELFPDEDVSQLARRQLDRFNRQDTRLASASLAALEAQARRAVELQRSDPEAAGRVWAAIIELYAGKPWAGEIVSRAREELERLNVADRR